MVSLSFTFIIALFTYILKQFSVDDSKPLLGKYMVPGKWYMLKYLALYIPLKIYQWYMRKTRRYYTPTLLYLEDEYKLDDIHEAYQPKDGDSVYFNGFDGGGNGVVCRLVRRPDRRAEVWLTLVTPQHGVYSYISHPDTIVSNTNGKEFRAGGLYLQMKEPLRLWRISFTGLLKKGLPRHWDVQAMSTDVETRFVKFTFHWRSMSELYTFQSINNIHPAAFAKSYAVEKWSRDLLSLMLNDKAYTHYHQWGQLLGEVTFEQEKTEQLRLRGLRERCYGELDWSDRSRNVKMSGLTADGFTFYINVTSFNKGPSHMMDGCVMYHNSNIRAISDSDLYLYVFGEQENNIPHTFTVHFTADGRVYTVEGTVAHTMLLYGGYDCEARIYHQILNLSVNGVDATGVMEYAYRNTSKCDIHRVDTVPMLKEADAVRGSSLVLPFSDTSCTSSKITGGKGSQLALLSTVQHEMGFTVPDGFCITVAAFQQQITSCNKLKEMLAALEKAVAKSVKSDMESVCAETVKAFCTEPVCESVRSAVSGQLEWQFAERCHDTAFAVRSSAVGEDSEDFSAAGQMETLLAIKGIEPIVCAVRECWASHFTYTAVEYRRQHGLEIVGDMAVCIQEMVASQTSGVLFTIDPVTGNPSVVTINANYGLGESVVSGVCEPDTITLRRRDPGNELTVTERTVGSKRVKIVAAESGGTVSEEPPEAVTGACCVTDDDALRLARIALRLELRFTSARDVEWAMWEGRIYILQARPVTTTEVESDYGLIHELDSALLTDYEILTRENVGEVLPGAITTLTIDHMTNVMDVAVQHLEAPRKALGSDAPNPYRYRTGIAAYHMFIDVLSNLLGS